MRTLLLALLALAGAAGADDEAGKTRAEDARAARERQETELLRRAQLQFDRKNHAAAARALEQVLATRGDDAAALALLGHCYFEMGKLEQARAALTRAVGQGRLTYDKRGRHAGRCRPRLPTRVCWSSLAWSRCLRS